jgi:hypothetical protein
MPMSLVPVRCASSRAVCYRDARPPALSAMRLRRSALRITSGRTSTPTRMQHIVPIRFPSQ